MERVERRSRVPAESMFTNEPESLIGLVAVVLGICVVALPAAVFGTAKKWSDGQPEHAGTILGGAVTICLASILTGAAIVLACIGWLPAPTF